MNPFIILGITFMAIGITIPCLFWFIRNLIRFFFQNDPWWSKKTLLWTWFCGLFLFVVGIIVLIVILLNEG